MSNRFDDDLAPPEVLDPSEEPQVENGQAAFDRVFGARVRAAREQAGTSQAHLVVNLALMHDIHVHQTSISRIERGDRPATVAEAVGIAELLGVSLMELVRGHPGDTVGSERALAELVDLRQQLDRRISRVRGELGPDPGGDRRREAAECDTSQPERG